ncbi:MAG: hypothetical protein GW903_01790 [Alphaproteobacteria bacterium]|nr:hypothetical protein [Alphaproteobacteria bacterium]NCQ87702.1 hypothetical protein [Alphaproteobacteria bacterium]NCT05789.1 hypothetical protein [Alphaproteobacteria bacterium]
MSREYAIKRIKEALHLTRGNETKARQQIAAWCLEDMKLLSALTKPHMMGIIAHAVGRVVSGKTEPQEVTSPYIKAASEKEGSFGMEILKTIAGGETNQFGQESMGRPIRKQGASQQHIDAIRLMVEKSQSKK